jgi:hypothetical protein
MRNVATKEVIAKPKVSAETRYGRYAIQAKADRTRANDFQLGVTLSLR